MIRHDDAYPLLHDLVDGQLDAATQTDVATHAAACPDCSRSLAALRSLRDAAAALPVAIAPPEDLWEGIADRLDVPDTSAPPVPMSRPAPRIPWPVWATAATIAAAVLIPSLRHDAGPAASPDMAVLDATYAAVRRDGENVIEAGELPPASADDLRAGMSAIDRAVGETRAALHRAADAPDQLRELTIGYRKKIDLLQRLVGQAARP